MSTQLKLRRGTTTQHSTFTGAEGEITIDTTKDTVVVHDGATVGGVPLAKESGSALSPTSVTLSTGTANGVAYLNGSKVLTTGSALSFDGSKLGINVTAGNLLATIHAFVAGGSSIRLDRTGAGTNTIQSVESGVAYRDLTLDSSNNIFSISGSEQMRLTSTGLGIGTSSPIAKLSNTGTAWAGGNATDGFVWRSTQNDWTATVLATPASGAGYGLRVHSLGTTASDAPLYVTSGAGAGSSLLLLNGSGNLSLGGTPSAWLSGYKAFDLAATSSVVGTGTGTWVFNNAYVNSSTGQNTYKTSAAATGYFQGATHQWYTAPSGTAGNAISFTQAMTLDASGNLALGSSSAYRSISNYVFQTINGTNASGIDMGYGGSRKYSIVVDYGGVYLTNASNTPMTFGTNDTERMRIDSNGNLLVGTTSNANAAKIKLAWTTGTYGIESVASANTLSYHIVFQNASYTPGSISTTNNATTYATSSDYRLKENIQPMQNALGVVAQLNPVIYNWKADGSDGQGFIAHELQAVVPDCVTGEKDAVDDEGKPVYQGIDTSFLVATLTKAIQELKAEVDSLKIQLENK